MKIEFEVVSDLYEAGRTEDGQRFEAERFYVQAEAEDGRRWRYHQAWNGATVSQDEEGINHFGDNRPKARALAEAVCRTVAKDAWNDAVWNEHRPAYGSGAWESIGGDALEIERERYEDERGWW